MVSTKLAEQNYANKLGKAHTNNNTNCVKLRREIGLLQAVGITIGCIIGSGIFISPKGIVSNVGSVGYSLLIWVACGFLSLIGSFCYAELGTTFPSAGGQYTYLYEAFGPCLAFLFLYTNTIILAPINSAILSLVVAEYVVQPFFPIGCQVPSSVLQLISAACICILTFLNCCNMQKVNKFINLFMFTKLFAISVIVVAGMYSIWIGKVDNFKDPWLNSKTDPGNIVLAIFSGCFAFGGWNAMAPMMEELKEPSKNLPRAIFIALFTVTVVYLLVNVSYFAVLTPSEIIQSNAVAVTFMQKVFGGIGWVVPLFVSMSCFGSLSINIMTNSRYFLMGARENQLPVLLSFISTANKTPIPSLIFLGGLSILYLYFADVFALIAFAAITQGFFNLAIIVGQITMRWTKPEISRPYKVSLWFPVTYVSLLLLLFIIPFYEQPAEAISGSLLIFTGVPIYYLFIVGKFQPLCIQHLTERLTELVQKIFLTVKED